MYDQTQQTNQDLYLHSTSGAGVFIGPDSGIKMLKVTVTFQRSTTDAEFFYTAFAEHPIVLALKDKFEGHPGFRGKEILVEEEYRVEIAMNFDTVENFLDFAKANQDLLDQRKAIIEDWCKQNNHTFEHTITSA